MTFTILFVGDRNVGRSVLAAVQVSRDVRSIWPRSADEVSVRSAGLSATDGVPVAPHLETVAVRRGFDVSAATATSLTEQQLAGADLVLTMTRRLRAQVLLQHPAMRTRTFALLEFVALLQSAAGANRQPLGRGERLEARLRLVVAAAVARRETMQPTVDDGRWDLFDPYAYSLDIYETVAAAIEAASHAIVGDIAVMTGARPSSADAFRTA